MKITHLIILLFSFLSLSVGAENIVSNMQTTNLPNKIRVSFDLSKNTEHFLQYNAKTRQVVLTLYNSKSQQKISKKIQSFNITRIYSTQHNKDLLVFFDVLEKVRIKSFLIESSNKYQLIIDFNLNQKVTLGIQASNIIDIIIDPGHGGRDVGAIGPLGTQEKTITLPIAKKIVELFNNQTSNIRAHLTRNTDVYVSLNNRIKKAQQVKADLYISIHADKYYDQQISGASIFILSNKKHRSKIANWLEKLELDSDFLSDKNTRYGSDNDVQTVLLDLANKANAQHSIGLAHSVISMFRGVFKLHSNKIQKAQFYVLKYSNIPSILIEVGFISNKQEERKLHSSSYQNKLAHKIFLATYQYIQNIRKNKY